MKELIIGLGVQGPADKWEIWYSNYSRQKTEFKLKNGIYRNINKIEFAQFNNSCRIIINSYFIQNEDKNLWFYLNHSIVLENFISPWFKPSAIEISKIDLEKIVPKKKSKEKKCLKNMD